MARKGRRIDHCEQARTKLLESIPSVWSSWSKSGQLTEKQAENTVKKITKISKSLWDICEK